MTRWRVAPGFDQYMVSDEGNVRVRFDRKWGKLKKGDLVAQNTRDGYATVTLRLSVGVHKLVKVHKLVAEAFCADRGSGPLVRHLDGDSLNNYWRNLMFGTTVENMLDAQRHRKTLRGNNHSMAKLTWEKAEQIRGRYASGGETYRSLAAEFGVGATIVRGIVAGRRWVPFA